MGYSPWGRKESDVTEQLTLSHFQGVRDINWRQSLASHSCYFPIYLFLGASPRSTPVLLGSTWRSQYLDMTLMSPGHRTDDHFHLANVRNESQRALIRFHTFSKYIK